MATFQVLVGEAENLEALVQGFQASSSAVGRFDDSVFRHRLSDDALAWVCEQSGHSRLTGALIRMAGRLDRACDGERR